MLKNIQIDLRNNFQTIDIQNFYSNLKLSKKDLDESIFNNFDYFKFYSTKYDTIGDEAYIVKEDLNDQDIPDLKKTKKVTKTKVTKKTQKGGNNEIISENSIDKEFIVNLNNLV